MKKALYSIIFFVFATISTLAIGSLEKSAKKAVQEISHENEQAIAELKKHIKEFIVSTKFSLKTKYSENAVDQETIKNLDLQVAAIISGLSKQNQDLKSSLEKVYLDLKKEEFSEFANASFLPADQKKPQKIMAQKDIIEFLANLFKQLIEKKFKPALRNAHKELLNGKVSVNENERQTEQIRKEVYAIIDDQIEKASQDRVDKESLHVRLIAEYRSLAETAENEETVLYSKDQVISALQDCYNIYKQSNEKDAIYHAKVARCIYQIDNVLRRLLKSKFDGNEFLILAAKYNCIELARYLIDKGYVTNICAQDDSGMTSYDWIRTEDNAALQGAHKTFTVKNGQVISVVRKPIHGNKEFADYLQALWNERRLTAAAQNALGQRDFALEQASKKDYKEATDAPATDQPGNSSRMLSTQEYNQWIENFKKYAKDTLEKRFTEFYQDVASQDPKNREEVERHLDGEFATYIELEIEILSDTTNADVSALQKHSKDMYNQIKHEVITWLSEHKKAAKNNQKKQRRIAQKTALNSQALKASEQANRMWDIHNDPYWHARYRGDADAQAARNDYIRSAAAAYNNDFLKWWQEHQIHNQDCIACKNHTQAMHALKNNPKRRNSF